MRKKEIKNLLKTLKKEKEVKGITFNPTLEECDYLNSLGVDITKDTISRNGIMTDYNYSLDVTNYVLN